MLNEFVGGAGKCLSLVLVAQVGGGRHFSDLFFIQTLAEHHFTGDALHLLITQLLLLRTKVNGALEQWIFL